MAAGTYGLLPAEVSAEDRLRQQELYGSNYRAARHSSNIQIRRLSNTF